MEHNDFADIRHVVNRSDILFDTRICLKTTITETTIFTLNTHSAISNGYAMSTVCCVIQKQKQKQIKFHESVHLYVKLRGNI